MRLPTSYFLPKLVLKPHKKILTASVILLLLLTNISKPYIHQSASYSTFADTRQVFHIKNGLNVISNLAYLYVGLAGLAYLRSKQSNSHFRLQEEKHYYTAIFIGTIFTFLGSSYYHLYPSDATLVWDRLPMTIVFMGFFSAVIAEWISPKLAKNNFPVATIFGIASVWYWHYSEQFIPGGNLRLYIDVQYFPLLLVPFIWYWYPPSYTRSYVLMRVLILYLVAKLFEVGDTLVFTHLKYFSGHTIKHFVSAYAIWVAMTYVRKRKPINRTNLG